MRAVRNACLLVICEFIGIYFFLLHLKTWWLASAVPALLTVAVGVLIKWTSYASTLLPPASRVLNWQATSPVLTVALGALLVFLLTTVSVNVRLVEGSSANIRVSSSRWRTSDILTVDSDRREANLRYFFLFTSTDLVIAPAAKYGYGSFTKHCVMPGTALDVRIPYSFPAKQSVCLLPAMGMRLPLPTDSNPSPFSGFVLVSGKKYPFRNWKVGALCFGGQSFEHKNDLAIAGAIDRVANMYFDSHAVDTSANDRTEYISLWKNNITSIATQDLMPNDTVYVEIRDGDHSFLRQAFEMGHDQIKMLFVEQEHEPKMVDEFGR